MTRSLIAPLLLVTLALLLPRTGYAQERLCDINAPGRTEQIITPGDTVIILYDPFTVTCTDGARLQASSGQVSRAERELHLTGDVLFQDAGRRLSAGEATYNSGTGRLFAEHEVVFENLTDGSTLRGPELEYFPATEERPLAEVNAGRRPQLQLPPPQGSAEGEPLELVADQVHIVGENDLTALGSVVITRTGLEATAGEARYDSATEELELQQDAVIRGEEFELAGNQVRATLREGSIEHIHAREQARLEGEELQVTAPELQLFFVADQLQRAIAVAPAASEEERATATAQAFRLAADSLDARFVEERIDLVDAIGNARGESIDTIAHAVAAAEDNDSLLSSDWIRGDTITGYFEPAMAAADADDPEAQPAAELRRLVARGSAQSLYRMPPEEGEAVAADRPNINFLVGEVIELQLVEGEVQIAQVTGLQQGLFLEARAEPVLERGPAPLPESDTGLPTEVLP